MTVKQLQEKLSKMPEELEVLIIKEGFMARVIDAQERALYGWDTSHGSNHNAFLNIEVLTQFKTKENA